MEVLSDEEIRELAEFLDPRLLAFVEHESSLSMRPHLLVRPLRNEPTCTTSDPLCFGGPQPQPRPHLYADRKLEELDTCLLAAVNEFESFQCEALTPRKPNVRQFAKPLSSEDIKKAMQSAVPEKTQRDTRY